MASLVALALVTDSLWFIVKVLLITIGGVAGVLGLFRMLSAISRIRNRRTRTDVADILEAFLNGHLSDAEWDDFVSVPISDPHLDDIARHVGRLPDEFPSEERSYCGPEGMEVMRRYIRELREANHK